MTSERNGILGILLLIGGVLLFFVVLNYFNIVSLSKIYPNQLGFLPHKPLPLPSPLNYNPVTKAKPIIYCPISTYPCTGKEIFNQGGFIGIGFKVTSGREIYAAIAGDAIFQKSQTATKSSILDTAIIIGKYKNEGYTAIYDFLGTVPNPKFRQILTGDRVGIATSGSYLKKKPEYKGINFIFKLLDSKNNTVQIKPSDFQ